MTARTLFPLLALLAACSPDDGEEIRVYPAVVPDGRILPGPGDAIWMGWRGVQAAELTGDEHLDLLAWGYEQLWLIPGPLDALTDLEDATLVYQPELNHFRTPPQPRDMTGDGIADLLFTPVGNGTAYIVPGPLEGAFDPELDGLAVTNAKDDWSIDNFAQDLSGDGVADLVFEIHADGPYGDERHEVWVAFGPFDTDRDVIEPDAWFLNEDYTMHPFDIGDQSGDGLADWAVGGSREEGHLHVWHGPFEEGADFEAPDVVLGHLDQDLNGTYLPDHLLSAGDLDGDGENDLIATFDGGTGYARVFHGPLAGDIDAEAFTGDVHGQVEGEGLGQYVLAPGDLDGDGLDDLLLVGREHGEQLTPDDAAFPQYGGVIMAIPGPMLGDVPATDDMVALAGGDTYGPVNGALAALGDIDGDGADEAAIGLYGYGAAFWYEEIHHESGNVGASYGWTEEPGAILLLGVGD